MPSALARIPASARRVTAFTVVALVVYVIFLGIGALFLGAAAAPGGLYSLSAIVAASVAALYLVYLGGLARLRELLP